MATLLRTILPHDSLSHEATFVFRRPTGSEAEVPAGPAEISKSTNPDHVGGFQVAMPIFNGIETKFGLVLPKFSSGVVNVNKPTS